MLANLFFRHVSSFRTATCFGMFDFGMFKCGPLHTKMRSFRHVSFFFPRASACLILASLILVICMQRCGPSGMFLGSACFGMFDFGMFDFGMFNYFLLSACCIPHTHTHFRPGAGLARGREAGLNCAAATPCGADMTDAVSCMQTFITSFCFGRFGPTRSCRQQL